MQVSKPVGIHFVYGGEDVNFALDESVRLIKEGYLSGLNSNDTGSFNFDVKLDESCNPCGNPFVD